MKQKWEMKLSWKQYTQTRAALCHATAAQFNLVLEAVNSGDSLLAALQAKRLVNIAKMEHMFRSKM